MRRSLVASLVLLIASLFVVSTAHAQRGRPTPPPPPPPPGGGIQPMCVTGCGSGSPWIVLVAPIGTVTTQYPTVTLEFCENAYAISQGSETIVINGVNRTSSFSETSGDPTNACGGGSGHFYATTSSVAFVSGSNSINASICDDGDRCANQTWYITYSPPAPGAPTIALRNQNGDNLDRGLCLTMGAGQSAGLSCGDLFVIHGMPSYRTLGRDRSLSLFYNSASAAPRPTVAVWVTEPAGTQTPNTVFAKLTVDGSQVATASYAPWSSSSNGTRQLVLSFDASNASTYASGIHSFTIEVQNQYPSVYSASTSGGLPRVPWTPT